MTKTCWDCAHFRDTDTEEQCFGDIPPEHDFNGRTTCSAFEWLDPRLAITERWLKEIYNELYSGKEIYDRLAECCAAFQTDLDALRQEGK